MLQAISSSLPLWSVLKAGTQWFIYNLYFLCCIWEGWRGWSREYICLGVLLCMGLVEYDYSYMKNYALLSSFFLLPVINQPLKHFLERWSSKCITHVLRIGSKSVFVHICAIFFCCFGPISKLYGEIVSSCLQRNKLACIPLQHNTRSATPTHTYTQKHRYKRVSSVQISMWNIGDINNEEVSSDNDGHFISWKLLSQIGITQTSCEKLKHLRQPT